MLIKDDRPSFPDRMRVTFSIPAAVWADTIYLVGDFNDWSTMSTPLRLDEDRWSVTLDLKRNQSYCYRYLVDNRDWMGDFHADRYVRGNDGFTSAVVVT